jgi:acyl transferase domain-containing protein
MLASRVEWYALLQDVCKKLKASGSKPGPQVLALFGLGDPIPLTPFNEAGFRVTKMEVSRVATKDNLQKPPIKDDAIAIVGAACRLPGAEDLEQLWDLMSRGISKCEPIRPERVPIQGSFRASQDPGVAKKKFFGNFVDGVEDFEHTFFNINSKDSASMDPQQRVLLELAYQAMDSSGYLRHHERDNFDNVGCFIGSGCAEYHENTSAHAATAYTATGTIRAFLCGKISYYFGWSGPSEVIDTACSSSLVAIHRACRAILSGECPLALAGGVNIITGMHNYFDLAKAGFLSPTGQCKPFDAGADGYCRADGAGLVVLKRLSEALANGEQVLGVITGVATNQGGLSSSITVPHSPSQIDLYQQVVNQSGLSPSDVSYVEAHGPGTQAGTLLKI